jgi:hypothetical protein
MLGSMLFLQHHCCAVTISAVSDLAELCSPQQTLCFHKFLDHRQIREVWNNFSTKVVNENFNKRGPSVDPCGTPGSRDKGEETFSKIRTKEALFDK